MKKRNITKLAICIKCDRKRKLHKTFIRGGGIHWDSDGYWWLCRACRKEERPV